MEEKFLGVRGVSRKLWNRFTDFVRTYNKHRGAKERLTVGEALTIALKAFLAHNEPRLEKEIDYWRKNSKDGKHS